MYTGIVDQLAARYDVVILVPESVNVEFSKLITDKRVIVSKLSDRPEPESWRTLRHLRKKIFLEVNRSDTERIKESSEKRKYYLRIGGMVLRQFTRLPFSKKLISISEAADYLINRDKFYEVLIKQYCPALVIGTSPFQYSEESLFRTAISNGIPCACFIPSWDNLSSKGVINQRFRLVLVWNEIMRQEILSGYPEYRMDVIKVVGIPQFDIYINPPEHDYISWCKQYGLNPARRTILYSTTPPRLFNYDPVIIGRLIEAIHSGYLPGNIQVLIRCHPWDNASRYEDLLGKGPVGICRSSAKPGASADRWIPPPDELLTLRDCLTFSVLNINMASTMSIDAAACGKPVLNVAFDGDVELSYAKSSRRYYDYTHYQKVVESGATKVCYSYDELFHGICNYLDNPLLDRDKRDMLVNMMCAFNDGKSSDRCVSELLNCIG